MNVLKGDYIGFKYNNVHSSDLGIMRVSDGSRFNENLLPNSQDKTVQIPGRDGTYYFGSYFTNHQFNISFVFDGITEQQLEFMKKLFGDKKIHPLIFDESPYKIYQAKITGTTVIKYIPFAEGETNRVYKGEGNIQFTCYQPYAVCSLKNLTAYDEQQIKEWNNAAKLVDLQEKDIDRIDFDNPGQEAKAAIKFYNPGVKESDWKLNIAFCEDGTIPDMTFRIKALDTDEEIKILGVEPIKAKSYVNSEGIIFRDEGISFNSANNLIEGYKIIDYDYDLNQKVKVPIIETTGNIYNEYITKGMFFKIPMTTYAYNDTAVDVIIRHFEILSEYNLKEIQEVFFPIQYNYYYY